MAALDSFIGHDVRHQHALGEVNDVWARRNARHFELLPRLVVTHAARLGGTPESGVLIFEPGNQAPNVTQLAWFDRTGKKLAFIGTPAVHYDLRLSPDARRLASSAGVPKSEIWVDDLQRGVRMRLTFDPESDNGDPVWSPDGSTLLFSTLRGSKSGVGIFKKASNGSGEQELFLSSDKPDREAWATDWSRDGRFLLFSRGDMANATEGEIWALPLMAERKPILFLHAAAAAVDAKFSPDGRWVAYVSRESGSFEVYVTSFDPTRVLNSSGVVRAGKWQISSDGGTTPRWRGDGKELFYIGPGNNIMSVEVNGQGDSFNVGRTQHLYCCPSKSIRIDLRRNARWPAICNEYGSGTTASTANSRAQLDGSNTDDTAGELNYSGATIGLSMSIFG